MPSVILLTFKKEGNCLPVLQTMMESVIANLKSKI